MFDGKNFKNLTAQEKEEKILKFWRDNKIFEKSVAKPKTHNLKSKTFVFFDGPPFATGLPHYGHILASVIKDVIPRYQTMKGKKVPRRWGWDCHGLPIENEIEKKLGLKTKKDIENIGIGKFNESARENVLQYADEWKKIIPRIGRWVDMENDYKTMDSNYTESVWWVFKSLFEKSLIYEGNKSMHICPRCETPLANFELNQPGAYKDITDISVVAKFELVEESKTENSTPKTQHLKPKTYFLAWTTTPWTLPGNVALAVNQNIKYQIVSIKGDDNKYIIAKDRTADAFKDKEYEIKKEFKGSELIGKKYKPLFGYYAKDEKLKNRENGWKIYAGDFVTTEEGTGIVHIAPAFGEDDMELAKKYDLPFIQHVSINGKFKPEVKDFAGLDVKPRENHQSTDIEIIKWLAGQNKLFKKEKIVHSYPHCWRCETPLLNYAASSWFVKTTAIKNKLIENNKKINWIPAHLKTGRFGKWLEEVRDWAISRSRFWGAPIPVWQCDKCDKEKVIGSFDELKNKIDKSGNKYFVMRHGMAEHNVKNIASAKVKNGDHLVEEGKKQSLAAANKLEKEKINIILSSDFIRTKETAEIIAEQLGLAKKNIIFDERLREVNVGIFDGQPAGEYHKYFSSLEEKFYKNPPQGENLTELKNRVADFLYEIERKYKNKNILIISHEYSIWQMFAASVGADAKQSAEIKKEKGDDFIKTGQVLALDFIPIPHNKNYELDLHRPYIDEIKFQCNCAHSTGLGQGGQMIRIPDVFDCWFESGSMPYGQSHYPFENKKEFEKNFPAEFIAEGLDQTRGWFYTLLVLSTALFKKPAYKNVIVNGIILAEDGQKMSKRLKNYPDPMEIINKYGADALRLYLLSSPAVRAENLNFSEKGVDEVYKKNILRLWNVYNFYELYSEKKIKAQKLSDIKSKNVLDIWILARLKELASEVSDYLDKYELDRAIRPIADFIDDLSTWYIRRSRVRFKTPFSRHEHIKEDTKYNDNAIKTTKFILLELAKITAPFTPFIAESIYKFVDGEESVHLQNWPKYKALPKNEKDILEKMKIVRDVVEKALALRQKAGIKVRQPLASIKIKNQSASWRTKIENNEDLLNLIKEEVNVKEIIFDENVKNEMELDMVITPELKVEGHLRELIRIIQDLRKEAGYTPKDRAILHIEADDYFKRLISNNMENLKKDIGVKTIELAKTEKFEAEIETKIDDSKIWLGIKKI